MNDRIAALAIAFAISYSTNTAAGIFGASNYEECVLDNMKGVTNDVVAYSVRNACSAKFPPKYPPNFYRIDASEGKREREVVGRIVVLQSFPQGMQVMNKNPFSISGVYVGMVQNSTTLCPDLESGFQAIHYCKGSVGGNQAGRILCSENIGKFCVTGFVTNWLDNPEKFFKDNDLIKK